MGNLFFLLLMVQKSGDHQLRLVFYPHIFSRFDTSPVVVWDFFHQPYHLVGSNFGNPFSKRFGHAILGMGFYSHLWLPKKDEKRLGIPREDPIGM